LIPILTSGEDIFIDKETISLAYDIREEKIREEIQLGQHTYKDRRRVMISSFGTDKTEFQICM
jgi:hypothetical protein